MKDSQNRNKARVQIHTPKRGKYLFLVISQKFLEGFPLQGTFLLPQYRADRYSTCLFALAVDVDINVGSCILEVIEDYKEIDQTV